MPDFECNKRAPAWVSSLRSAGLHPHSYVSHAVTSKRYAQNVNNEYLVTDSMPSVHHWPSNSSPHSIPSIRNNYHLPSSIWTNLVNKIIINSSRFAKTHSHVHIRLEPSWLLSFSFWYVWVYSEAAFASSPLLALA